MKGALQKQVIQMAEIGEFKEMELIDEDAIKSLPPSERKKYKRKKVYEYLKGTENGATKSELQEALPFGDKAISQYLETLKAKRKVYVVDGRGTSKVFHPNGKAIHPLKEFSVEGENRKYSLRLLEQPTRNELFVQEKEKSGNGIWEDAGAVTIPFDEISKFISVLENIQREMDQKNLREVSE